jgi:alpha-galactosidase
VGCELLTVDAGWYGKGAKADWCYLGEWEVNKERLPNGLEAVAAEVRKLGMKFGLWVEIECVTPNSPLGKEHPDWYLRDGDRLLSGRGVLNLGHPQALAWVKSVIDRLVTTYRLDYIKMDFNTDPALDSERFAGGSDPLHSHYRGLVELWKHMRARYPQLVVENCSSGSLRQDLMTAALTDTHWVSDNVENKANLAMNFGATYLFPPEICNHWTTTPARPAQGDAGPGSALDLESQFTANMLGHLGLSGRIDRWDAETRRIAAERVALYKRIRPLLRNADVYHLTPQLSAATPRSVQAALYVDANSRKALLFAFQGGAPTLEATLRLRGLSPEPRYRLRMPPAFGPEQVLSGAELVEKGLPVRFPHRGASAVIEIEPAPEQP